MMKRNDFNYRGLDPNSGKLHYQQTHRENCAQLGNMYRVKLTLEKRLSSINGVASLRNTHKLSTTNGKLLLAFSADIKLRMRRAKRDGDLSPTLHGTPWNCHAATRICVLFSSSKSSHPRCACRIHLRHTVLAERAQRSTLQCEVLPAV